MVFAGVLVAEVVVTRIVWRAVGYVPRFRRRGALLLSAIAGFLLSIVIGGSGLALGVGALAVLLPTFVVSLWRENEGSSRSAALRVLGVLVAAALCADPLHPSRRSTEALIALAAAPSAQSSPGGWVDDELRARADAVPAIEARLEDEHGDGRTSSLLALHARLADPARHAEVCARVPTCPQP
jgi:hypothetical protein